MTSEPSIDQTCSGSDSVAANETPPPGGQNIAPKTPGGSATMPPKIAMQKNSSGGGLAKWKAAALKIRALPDPWAGSVDSLHVECLLYSNTTIFSVSDTTMCVYC